MILPYSVIFNKKMNNRTFFSIFWWGLPYALGSGNLNPYTRRSGVLRKSGGCGMPFILPFLLPYSIILWIRNWAGLLISNGWSGQAPLQMWMYLRKSVIFIPGFSFLQLLFYCFSCWPMISCRRKEMRKAGESHSFSIISLCWQTSILCSGAFYFLMIWRTELLF